MTDQAEPIIWANETRRLGELVPWPRNPRQIYKDQATRLSESLREFGQPEVIAIGPGNEIYNGHQRLNVWMDEYGPDFEVAVRVSSRPLAEKEREKLTVLLHRGAVGEWDWDVLANEFEVAELLEWGFESDELGGIDLLNEQLLEREKNIRPREMLRVLVSVPVDEALRVRASIDSLAGVPGIEIDYGASDASR